MFEDDDMGESIISARLRRLREEAEKDVNPFRPDQSLPLPVSERKRESKYVPVEVEIQTARLKDGGIVLENEIVSTVADSSAGAFEFVIHKGWLERKDDPQGIGMARQRAGFRLRSLVHDAEVTPLRGQNYEGGGGGGGPPKPIGDHTIDCIKHLKSVERELGADQLSLLRDVIFSDRRPWEGRTGQAVKVEVDRFVRALDHLAAYFGLITEEEVRARWQAKRSAPRESRPEAQEPA